MLTTHHIAFSSTEGYIVCMWKKSTVVICYKKWNCKGVETEMPISDFPKVTKSVRHWVWQDTKICQTERKSVRPKQMEQKQSKTSFFAMVCALLSRCNNLLLSADLSLSRALPASELIFSSSDFCFPTMKAWDLDVSWLSTFDVLKFVQPSMNVWISKKKCWVDHGENQM